MVKSKKSSEGIKTEKKSKTVVSEEKSMTPGNESLEEKTESMENTSMPVAGDVHGATDNEPAIRILYRTNCPKLTTRGVGELQYEIGFDDTIAEAYLRIAGNASSGAFSTKWIGLNDIRSIIEKVKEESFRAIILRDLYFGRSSNNHGYLGSVLKSEGVLIALPKQPTVLRLESWDPLLEKIDSLKKTDICLPDLIAEASKKKAVKKSNV